MMPANLALQLCWCISRIFINNTNNANGIAAPHHVISQIKRLGAITSFLGKGHISVWLPATSCKEGYTLHLGALINNLVQSRLTVTHFLKYLNFEKLNSKLEGIFLFSLECIVKIRSGKFLYFNSKLKETFNLIKPLAQKPKNEHLVHLLRGES